MIRESVLGVLLVVIRVTDFVLTKACEAYAWLDVETRQKAYDRVAWLADLNRQSAPTPAEREAFRFRTRGEVEGVKVSGRGSNARN